MQANKTTITSALMNATKFGHVLIKKIKATKIKISGQKSYQYQHHYGSILMNEGPCKDVEQCICTFTQEA